MRGAPPLCSLKLDTWNTLPGSSLHMVADPGVHSQLAATSSAATAAAAALLGTAGVASDAVVFSPAPPWAPWETSPRRSGAEWERQIQQTRRAATANDLTAISVFHYTTVV